jgi:hypothetical protein
MSEEKAEPTKKPQLLCSLHRKHECGLRTYNGVCDTNSTTAISFQFENVECVHAIEATELREYPEEKEDDTSVF